MKLFALVALALAWLIMPAEARKHRHHPGGWLNMHDWHGGWHQPRKAKRHKIAQHRKARQHKHHIAPRGLVTVPTAAGIRITVSPTFAPRITAFIADLVAGGYKPKSIHCFARGGHVHGSRHYSGNACDIDQRAWNKTHPRMYRVAGLAKKHGLRDGGSFGDHGHIDDGKRLTRIARAGPRRVARLYAYAQPRFTMQTVPAW